MSDEMDREFEEEMLEEVDPIEKIADFIDSLPDSDDLHLSLYQTAIRLVVASSGGMPPSYNQAREVAERIAECYAIMSAPYHQQCVEMEQTLPAFE